jgi:hypothetical protein
LEGTITWWFATLVAGAGSLWVLSERAEKVTSAYAKEQAAAWLQSSPARLASSLGATFRDAFDAVFGTRHFSLNCFMRSCIASYASVLTTGLMWATFWTADAAEFWRNQTAIHVVIYAFFVLTINVFPDYLSLLETRWVISMLTARASKRVIPWIVADAILTALISLIGLLAAAFVAALLLAPLIWALDRAFSTPQITQVLASLGEVVFWIVSASFDLWQIVRLKTDDATWPPLGIFFYSAFFTSAWLWMFTIGGWLLHRRRGLEQTAYKIWRVLDMQNHPFLCIGAVGIAVLVVLWTAVLPLILLRS